MQINFYLVILTTVIGIVALLFLLYHLVSCFLAKRNDERRSRLESDTCTTTPQTQEDKKYSQFVTGPSLTHSPMFFRLAVHPLCSRSEVVLDGNSRGEEDEEWQLEAGARVGPSSRGQEVVRLFLVVASAAFALHSGPIGGGE